MMFTELWRTIRLGVKSLLLHKLRAALTMAGMLFGVASVIIMLAVGEGTSYDALQQFEAMGTNNILLRSKKPATTQQSSEQSVWSAMSYGLTYAEAERVENTLRRAKNVVRVRETPKNLRSGAFWDSSVVIGTEPDYVDVVNMDVAEGRFLDATDLDEKRNVCVLGASLSKALFPIENPLGQMVQAGDEEKFQVVGALDYQGRAAGASGTTLDECLFIPVTTSRARFGDTNTQSSGGSFSRERIELMEIKVRVHKSTEVEDTAEVLRQMLEADHASMNDLEITVPLELLRQKEASQQLFKVLLGCIAGISLLVGGIGIMNVMLATVTERTREIGIRRALGAKKKNIVYQFLVETVVLAACGGLLGVLLGVTFPSVITALLDQTTIVLLPHVVLAFCISAAVGIAFGIYPAWRAASMDPVEALRHE